MSRVKQVTFLLALFRSLHRQGRLIVDAITSVTTLVLVTTGTRSIYISCSTYKVPIRIN